MIGSREFSEWMAYFRLEPFGAEREDMRAGIIAATIANANRDPKKRPKPFTPGDFMLKFGEEYREPEVLSPEETLKRVIQLHEAMGGVVSPELRAKVADGQ
jgi:hypothetical protein